MKQIEAVYIGRRISTTQAIIYSWLFIEDGKEIQRNYSKNIARLPIIGQFWKFMAEQETESFTVHIGGKHAPVPCGTVLDNRHIEWSAEDTASVNKAESAAMQKKLTKNADEFKNALLPLQDMLDKIKSHNSKAAFIHQVTAELWRRS